MYTTAKDAPVAHTFDQAKAYCAALDTHGHRDWRVPTRNELNELFNNRVAIGGFDEFPNISAHGSMQNSTTVWLSAALTKAVPGPPAVGTGRPRKRLAIGPGPSGSAMEI
jgi:hypothetical protein